VLSVLVAALASLRSLGRTRRELALENLALRQQLAILRRVRPERLRLKSADRIFWAWLSSVWAHWADALVIVRPDTVVRWHRRGFRLVWRWKSRRQGPGRPPVSKDIQDLIRRMANENLGWGAPRIHGELLKLVVHWNVTSGASAEWAAQQVVDAFPEDTALPYLLRDRDGLRTPRRLRTSRRGDIVLPWELLSIRLSSGITRPHARRWPAHGPAAFAFRSLGQAQSGCLRQPMLPDSSSPHPTAKDVGGNSGGPHGSPACRRTHGAATV
jgi:hypothetical protein